MILSGHTVAHYLAGRGLMTLESVVADDFVVVEISRRNQNFRVVRRSAPGFFVKQIRDGSPDALTSLAREATCYQLASSRPSLASLATLVPTFRAYDAENHVLVVELLRDGENLREHADRVGAFSPDVARQLGTALGTYHAMPASQFLEESDGAAFAPRAPWILSFHQQTFAPGSVNAGTAEVHRILCTYPDYARALDAIAEGWQSDTLIHGDIKWDNCMLYATTEGAAARLKVVDWELASLGDACWDVGAILQAYLSSWVLSMPDTGATPGDLLIQQARMKLEHMLPAIHVFWDAYAAARGVGHDDVHPLLERSLRYGAARMVQTVFEIATYSGQMSPLAARLLQLSYNILSDTPEAVARLLAA